MSSEVRFDVVGLKLVFDTSAPRMWRKSGLRLADFVTVIVHEYFGVDAEIIWGVIERDLPNLKERVLHLLAS